MKNVELTDGFAHTELDAVVITPKCITIVEVKNTGKDIFIDEDGSYYRTGEFLKLDCNIAEKMRFKEMLLRNVLDNAGYSDLQIREVVVFTKNRIEVQNKYKPLKTCFLSQLTHVVESCELDDVISVNQMEDIKAVVNEASSKVSYPFDFDTYQYKKDFAELMTIIELGKIQLAELEENCDKNEIDSSVHSEKVKMFNLSHMIKKVGGAAAVFALGFMSSFLYYKGGR